MSFYHHACQVFALHPPNEHFRLGYYEVTGTRLQLHDYGMATCSQTPIAYRTTSAQSPFAKALIKTYLS